MFVLTVLTCPSSYHDFRYDSVLFHLNGNDRLVCLNVTYDVTGRERISWQHVAKFINEDRTVYIL